MKSIVIYNSQTGFTKKYAEWIAEATGCELVSFAEAKTKDFSGYDMVLFGSWCRAGSVVKLGWFKKLMKQNPGKKYGVYAVGASPIMAPVVEKKLKKNLAGYEKICKEFYCGGGLCYEKMDGISRSMMKAFAKMTAKKKNPTEEDKQMAEMISKDYDISDKKYIEPIVEYMK